MYTARKNHYMQHCYLAHKNHTPVQTEMDDNDTHYMRELHQLSDSELEAEYARHIKHGYQFNAQDAIDMFVYVDDYQNIWIFTPQGYDIFHHTLYPIHEAKYVKNKQDMRVYHKPAKDIYSMYIGYDIVTIYAANYTLRYILNEDMALDVHITRTYNHTCVQTDMSTFAQLAKHHMFGHRLHPYFQTSIHTLPFTQTHDTEWYERYKTNEYDACKEKPIAYIDRYLNSQNQKHYIGTIHMQHDPHAQPITMHILPATNDVTAAALVVYPTDEHIYHHLIDKIKNPSPFD